MEHWGVEFDMSEGKIVDIIWQATPANPSQCWYELNRLYPGKTGWIYVEAESEDHAKVVARQVLIDQGHTLN